MTIGDLVDSKIVQILPIATAKKIVSIMMGTEETAIEPEDNSITLKPEVDATSVAPKEAVTESMMPTEQPMNYNNNYSNSNQGGYGQMPVNPYNNGVDNQGYNEVYNEPVNVKQASFKQLDEVRVHNMPNNIDLILDVPLELSVELGRTKKNIREILDLAKGSLIELNKLAEEPVDIFVNGKKIAYGEVVVVDENFGVKITEIASGEERVKSLSK